MFINQKHKILKLKRLKQNGLPEQLHYQDIDHLSF
jgi:hypothetical protein